VKKTDPHTHAHTHSHTRTLCTHAHTHPHLQHTHTSHTYTHTHTQYLIYIWTVLAHTRCHSNTAFYRGPLYDCTYIVLYHIHSHDMYPPLTGLFLDERTTWNESFVSEDNATVLPRAERLGPAYKVLTLTCRLFVHAGYIRYARTHTHTHTQKHTHERS